MKAQVLYEAQEDGVISGDDLQEFFLQINGEYSISGHEDVPEDEAKKLLHESLQGQIANSPSMENWAGGMAKKYNLPKMQSNKEFWEARMSAWRPCH